MAAMGARGGEEDDPFGVKSMDDRPEVRFINRYVLLQTCVLMAVRGTAFLALTWSTVVLLGGFVTLLQKKDFWYLTLISLIQSSRIFNVMADEHYLNFLDLLVGPIMRAFGRNKNRRVTSMWQLGWQSSGEANSFWKGLMFKLMTTVLLILVSLLVLHPLLVLYWCIVVPATRLSQQDYGQDDGDSSKANLKPGMMIFYSLALAQGTLYMLWFVLNAGSAMLVRVVASKCQFEESWGRKSVVRYLSDTKFMCLKDPLSIKDRNLIKYAAGLLDSDSEEDYITGARMLVSFLEKQKLPVKLLIRSSRIRTQKLIAMLGLADPADREMRKLAAIIVTHVAGNISLAQFPGALQSIYSLLDPHDDPSFIEKEDQQHDHDKGNARCQLIVQGLLVVERLTRDNNNCILIFKDLALLNKIWRPIIRSYKSDQNMCAVWPDMLKGSLRSMAFLLAGTPDKDPQMPGFIFTKLSKSVESVITAHGKCPDIQIAAIALYAQLLLGYTVLSKVEPFVNIMLPLFLSCTDMKRGEEISTAEAQVKVLAGAALAKLSDRSNNSSVHDIIKGHKDFHGITRLLIVPNATVREIASEILENVYVPEDTTRLILTEKVITELFRTTSQTGKQAQTGAVAITVEAEDDGAKQFQGDHEQATSHARPEHEEQSNYTELQATLVPLLVSTFEYGTNCLVDAIQKTAPTDGLSTFVGMLKTLVENNSRVSRVATQDGVQILKATAVLVKTLMLDTRFVQEIRRQKIVEALSGASKIVSGTSPIEEQQKASDLELWKLLSYNIYHQRFRYTAWRSKQLSSHVNEAQKLLDDQQQVTVQVE